VLIHDDNGIDVFVMGRDELTELEHGALFREIEHLRGRSAWQFVDDEPQKGWFAIGSFENLC
jgi:hypothetical protein